MSKVIKRLFLALFALCLIESGASGKTTFEKIQNTIQETTKKIAEKSEELWEKSKKQLDKVGKRLQEKKQGASLEVSQTIKDLNLEASESRKLEEKISNLMQQQYESQQKFLENLLKVEAEKKELEEQINSINKLYEEKIAQLNTLLEHKDAEIAYLKQVAQGTIPPAIIPKEEAAVQPPSPEAKEQAEVPDLMRQIRERKITLKKVSDVPAKPKQQQEDLFTDLKDRLDKIREAVEDEDSDETDNDWFD